MKKKIVLLLASPVVIALASCGGGGGKKPEEEIKFTQIVNQQEEMTIDANGQKELMVNYDIKNNNYLKLLVNSTSNFKGQFVYSEIADATHIVSEDFFVEGNATEEVEFRQFLDAFRTDLNSLTGEEMSVGDFSKRLEKIVFINYQDTPINITVNGLYMSDHKIPELEKEIYIEKDNLKVGMDLSTGGTLTYLEKTSMNGKTVNEVLNDENKIEIGPGFTGEEKLSEHVNLINIYDPGRQIQQSYYAGVGGNGGSEIERQKYSDVDANGYKRRWCNTAGGYYWPYNPVQGGDEASCISQIIDYRKSEDELYCKVRSLDWAAGKGDADHPINDPGNRVTKSYTENWYTIKDGVLYAKNRFIDWNGFTDLNTVAAHNLEIPATYIAHPLHTFCCYDGIEPWTGDVDNFDIQPELGSWKHGSYQTSHHEEDWFAWVNGEDMSNAFGVGIYIPGANYYASGRSDPSTNVDVEINHGAYAAKILETQYNKPDPTSDYTSCYVRNTDYTAPVVTVRMKEYKALEYQYVVAVDYVKSFRKRFKKIHTAGEIDAFNAAGLTAWN